MKQIKFKQLATFGLCCSLLVNSLTGVTAVAETVTIESSPTAESTKESPKESAEESTQESIQTKEKEKTPEPSNNEIKEEKQEETTTVQEQKQAENIDKQVITEPMNPYGSVFRLDNQRALSTVTFPARSFQIYFVDEGGGIIDPSMVTMSAQSQVHSLTRPNGPNTLVVVGPKSRRDLIFTNVSNSKRFSIPRYTTQYSSAVETSEYFRTFYGVTNIKITIPKRYEKIDYLPSSYYKGSSYPAPVVKSYNMTTGTYGIDGNSYFTEFYRLAPDTQPYTYKEYRPSPDSSGLSLGYYDGDTIRTILYGTTAPMYYYLTNRRVTENFVDVSGAEIAPPTGFTQGNQTVVDTDNFTYTSSKSLPDTYTADGKTYKFKGWYKGKTKPETLETSKTPSYKVTYDDNDDLNVVYEEEEATNKDYNFPSRAVSFQFLNEAGTIISPTPFTITTDLQQEINSTYTKLESITGTDSGNTKQVKIPAKTIEADVSLGGVNSYGTTNTRITIPKFYENISVYTGSAYTQATLNRYSTADNTLIGNPASNAPLYYGLNKMTTTQFKVNEYDTTTTIPEQSEYLYNRLYVSGASRLFNSYVTPVGTIYYQLTNRKVTENFVDSTGAKITAPTGFKQGKQTVIDSDDFTYTQEGTLPYIYKINNKPYVLKGWYKGKGKPEKLNQITKEKPNVSYPVSYDDQDDVTVVYDELKLAGNTIQFGFVNEQGNYIPPTSEFNVSTDVGEVTNATYTKLQTVNSTINGNYLSLTIPAYNPTGGIGQGTRYYGSRNSIVTIPKYYKPPTLTPPTNYAGATYPTATGVVDYHDAATYEYLPSRLNLTSVSGSQTNYRLSQVRWQQDDTQTAFSNLYKMNAASTSDTNMGLAEIYATGTVNYYLENRRVTENFVDDTGAKITPPADFTQGKQTVIDSDNFTYTSAKALPDTYTAGDKSYQFKGWYKGTDKTALKTTKTPSYAVTYDDKDDMTAVYEEVQATAEMTVNRLLEVVPNEASMIWTVRLKNTSEAPLTNVKLAPTAKWAAGISAPTQLAVRIGNTPNKIIPVTAEQWQAGVNLDIEIPVNGEALVTVNTAKITGEPRQLLTAEMTASGNFFPVTASNFVRIQGEDQTIEPTPAEEGFISTPTFDFGKIMISGSTKQYSLKKAADYYGNGTRNPYLRIKTSQPNWQLTAQLSQLKASTDSLPTSTRLLLGNADVAAIENYNLVTELTNKVGITEPLALTSDGTSTPVILTNQFTGNDVYQLEFDFASVKLEVPANQGKINEKYQGTVTWNLVTGP
ncbi:WxL domain-containing protein [Enterococcus faecalis]|uniref:WxL domain-containing protein n=3 Tax=Enterococcus faecalis TaxID=1351 RepID=UPI002224BC71|nr:WxL domain-containing protein [Enterococcus faecalis]UYY19530.1 WxL domain-containing protein [Enterococcus faecalis]UYY22101.1 WxL domain-containing protein [Enterococcus faecalis]